MLGIGISGNQQTITLTWDGGAMLLQADAVTGPWNPVPGATSPYTVTADKAAQFYRVICQ